ncbi:hypothetical protein JOF56_004947 [Kibdelosporangium banguiense]|uniref:Uncharacterized protein n=1 Tax=Kibdelosporangium banguiense TaxID=1365924 RepID=A0ABS4TJH0_9PSEU|nr:PA2928 family protein [Kibdelosporangium banguiense]MBP2324562.1 hypothetical protein [Kibdelosporangium banguiense]
MNYTLPVAPYESPRPRRRRFPVLFFVPFLIVGFMLFGVSYLAFPEPDVEVQPGVGVTKAGGREIVLVPYARHGVRGMFQLIFRDMFQVRLAAADAGTGEVLWDTQLSDELIWEASVLAAGERYVYLATDSGLTVLDVRDGSLVDGLPSPLVAARSAYGYDAQNRQIMALNTQGAVLAIRLDALSAAPAEPQAAAAWAQTLSAERHIASPPSAIAAEATLAAGERLKLHQLALGSVLVRVAADGKETPVNGTVFHRAAIVVDGPAAAGGQYALIKHSASVNDTSTVLTAVSLETGTVTGSLTIGAPERAVALPNGMTAVVTDSGFATVGTDGRVTALPIGATDFFGN